jgi:hypothetical protein
MAKSLGADMNAMQAVSFIGSALDPTGRNIPGELPISNARIKIDRLGISSDDWSRLPGQLRDEILQGAGAEGPQEYREYIKRYFREVARRSGTLEPPARKQEKGQ